MPVIISLFYRKVAQRLARREVDQKGRTLGTNQQFHRLNLGQSLVIQKFAHEPSQRDCEGKIDKFSCKYEVDVSKDFVCLYLIVA